MSIPFRIACWNIKGQGMTLYDTQYRAIERSIERTRPDVITLSEVTSSGETDVRNSLGPEHGYYYAAAASEHIALAGPYQNMVISKFPILRSGVVTSPAGADEMERNPLFVEIDIGHPRQRLLVYAVHCETFATSLPTDGNSAPSLEFHRAIEWQRIKASIAAQLALNPNLRVIVLGDFNGDNEYPQTESFASEPGTNVGYTNFDLGGDITFPVQYATYPNYQISQCGLTLVEAENLDGDRSTFWTTPPFKLDYMGYSSGISLTGAEVLDSEATQTGGLTKYGSTLATTDSQVASDHKMTFADFSVESASTPFSPRFPSRAYLEETQTGTTYDDSMGSVTDGTIAGTFSRGNDTDTIGRRYLDLGANGYVDLGAAPILPETADWTLMGWFRPSSVSGLLIMFSQYGFATGNGRLLFDTNGTALRLFLGDDGTRSSATLTGGTLAAGTWYHGAAVRDGNDFRLYLDGVLIDTHSDASAREIMQDGCLLGARATAIGTYKATPGNFFGGDLADWIFFDHALSFNELTWHANPANSLLNIGIGTAAYSPFRAPTAFGLAT